MRSVSGASPPSSRCGASATLSLPHLTADREETGWMRWRRRAVDARPPLAAALATRRALFQRSADLGRAGACFLAARARIHHPTEHSNAPRAAIHSIVVAENDPPASTLVGCGAAAPASLSVCPAECASPSASRPAVPPHIARALCSSRLAPRSRVKLESASKLFGATPSTRAARASSRLVESSTRQIVDSTGYTGKATSPVLIT